MPVNACDDVWFDRDLGWLEFNRRVLAEAQDDRTPLLERLKFLAIFTSNLDEFFMKRIATLRLARDGSTAALLSDLRRVVADLIEQERACLASLGPRLPATASASSAGATSPTASDSRRRGRSLTTCLRH